MYWARRDSYKKDLESLKTDEAISSFFSKL